MRGLADARHMYSVAAVASLQNKLRRRKKAAALVCAEKCAGLLRDGFHICVERFFGRRFICVRRVRVFGERAQRGRIDGNAVRVERRKHIRKMRQAWLRAYAADCDRRRVAGDIKGILIGISERVRGAERADERIAGRRRVGDGDAFRRGAVYGALR